MTVPVISKCAFCGRSVVVMDGKLREHLPRGGWAKTKCPGSGSRAAS